MKINNTTIVVILLAIILLWWCLSQNQRSNFIPQIPYVPFFQLEDRPPYPGDYLLTTGNTATGEDNMAIESDLPPESYQHYPTSYYDQNGWIGNKLPWVPSSDILNNIF